MVVYNISNVNEFTVMELEIFNGQKESSSKIN